VPEPTLDAATSVGRRHGVIAERMLEETVILDPASDRYARLNATGRLMWEQLSAPRTLGELAAVLAAEYGIDERRALSDVTAFVEAMVARGLVEPAPAT
jgi:hypothetical protein